MNFPLMIKIKRPFLSANHRNRIFKSPFLLPSPQGEGLGVRFLSFCLVLSTVFAVDETLANGVVSAKYFWFYGAMGITTLTSLLVYGCRRTASKFYAVDFLFFLFTCYVLVVNYFDSGNTFSTKWVLLVQLLLLFIYFRVALQDKTLRFYLTVFFIFTGLVEAVWGLRQLYGFIPSYHNLFKLTGSFFNSGPYSGYVVVVAPLALYTMLKDAVVFKRKFFIGFLPYYVRFTVSILAFTGVVLVLPATMSRAAWIAALVGCGFVLSQYYLQKKHVKDYLIRQRKIVILFLCISVVLLACGAVGIYQLKKNSADGRALIWKTTMKMIPKHPMGVGLGQFPAAYGKEQAVYFATGNASAQEELVAGNPDYAFNEYLQIIAEFGVVAALIIFATFILLIYMGIKRKAIAETGGLISLLVFASMSYPFNLLPFLIVLVFLMASILTQKQAVRAKGFTEKSIVLPWQAVLMLLTAAVIILCATLYQRYPTYNAYKEWNNLKMLGSADAYPEMKNDYEKLYPYLSDQIPFLFEYAQCLSKAGEYEKSNHVLEQAIKISCDPMLYNVMGKNYQSLKNYQLSEQNFLLASRIVPSRIYPYYLLANLYAESGNTQQAMFMAQKVLKKEPKVQSTAVNEMREKMRVLIKGNGKSELNQN
jgi:tetratricopeptide (TPR) repeat protein